MDALAVLLEELNCTVLRSHDSLIVDPSRMENVPLVSDAVDKLRASYYLMGALLGKCKKSCDESTRWLLFRTSSDRFTY